MRTMGLNDTLIQARVPEKLALKIKAKSTKKKISESEVIRLALKKYLRTISIKQFAEEN